MFAEPIPNVTVPLGRDVSLPCVVENLGNYKVIKSKSLCHVVPQAFRVSSSQSAIHAYAQVVQLKGRSFSKLSLQSEENFESNTRVKFEHSLPFSQLLLRNYRFKREVNFLRKFPRRWKFNLGMFLHIVDHFSVETYSEEMKHQSRKNQNIRSCRKKGKKKKCVIKIADISVFGWQIKG